MTHADLVAQIHRDYFAAGADIVETNSFGGSRLKLGAYGRGDEVARFNTAALRLAMAVRDGEFPDRLVAGDVGPTGKFMKPLGELEPEELREVFAEQAAALADGGPDLISIQTFFDLTEARAAVRGRAPWPALPLISLAFKPTPERLPHDDGRDPAQAAATLARCRRRRGRRQLRDHRRGDAGLVAELRAATDAPLVIQPNAGQPRLGRRPHALRGDAGALR